jgi:hypothetical protein
MGLSREGAGTPALMTTLSPPSRRIHGVSNYGLCVMSACQNRARWMTTLRIGGHDRQAAVCNKHVRLDR